MPKRLKRLPKGSLTFDQAHDRAQLLSTAYGLMDGVANASDAPGLLTGKLKFVAFMKKQKCPNCGAGYKHLLI